MLKISLSLRRVVHPEFLAALVSLSRAKGLDVKHSLHLGRIIRRTKDEAQLYADARDAALARNNGETVNGPGGSFHRFTTDDHEVKMAAATTDSERAEIIAATRKATTANRAAFLKDDAELLKQTVEFEMPSLIKPPELTGDSVAEVLEFLEP